MQAVHSSCTGKAASLLPLTLTELASRDAEQSRLARTWQSSRLPWQASECDTQAAWPSMHQPNMGVYGLQALGKNLRVPRAPQAPKEGSGDGVFMRLMALPKGRGMLTRALRVLYAPPLLAEAVPGDHLRSLMTTCSCQAC